MISGLSAHITLKVHFLTRTLGRKPWVVLKKFLEGEDTGFRGLRLAPHFGAFGTVGADVDLGTAGEDGRAECPVGFALPNGVERGGF